MKLAFALIRPHIKRRSLVGLQTCVTRKMSITLEQKVQTHQDQQNRISSRAAVLQEELHPKKRAKISKCKQCYDETAGPGQRKKLQNMSKNKNQCQICALATCAEHTVQMCMQCYLASQHRNLKE